MRKRYILTHNFPTVSVPAELIKRNRNQRIPVIHQSPRISCASSLHVCLLKSQSKSKLMSYAWYSMHNVTNWQKQDTFHCWINKMKTWACCSHVILPKTIQTQTHLTTWILQISSKSSAENTKGFCRFPLGLFRTCLNTQTWSLLGWHTVQLRLYDLPQHHHISWERAPPRH